MLRVFREPDGTWSSDRYGMGVTPRWRDGPKRADSIEEFEDEVADRLAILLLVDPGVSLDNVGRRINNDIFWLFYEVEAEAD
ncbi:hypothetical protein GH984_02775 [Spiribacter sp. C176]|uniref:Uncharacterized protein n=1 Tax=Spiribacter salilacus TaxID=2664894 RepID=A0A6N7QNK8_9GAMM|nr:hypothetical protein [Spiribacter salilacus]MRH77622.1 hypothetical protein [Spiribacter salilacus]